MKLDICLMNPPYGARKSGDENLHFKFVEKCLDLCENQIVIMPIRAYQSSNKKYDDIKKIFKKSLINIEEVDSKKFEGTGMGNVGIYKFDIKKSNNDEPEITYITKFNERYEFSDYEQSFVKYLKNDNIQKMRKHYQNPGKESKKDKNLLYKLCDKLPDNKVYLTSNLANGGMNALFISKNTGNIFTSKKDLAEYWYNNNGRGFCCLIMNNVKSAENCKIALQNPLLRFTLYRLQDDQNMHKRVYVYVPDIDWSNDKVKTDEGLLEVCGCPKDKAKEYAEYCKKIIDEVDKK